MYNVSFHRWGANYRALINAEQSRNAAMKSEGERMEPGNHSISRALSNASPISQGNIGTINQPPDYLRNGGDGDVTDDRCVLVMNDLRGVMRLKEPSVFLMTTRRDVDVVARDGGASKLRQNIRAH
jgi:hypothetical protein